MEVSINNVQLGTASSMKDKNGSQKFVNFKPLSTRKGLLHLDWKNLGPVDLVVNMDKKRFRIYPTGTTELSEKILDAKIRVTKKGELWLDWVIGEGRTRRSGASIFFHIPPNPPALIKKKKAA